MASARSHRETWGFDCAAVGRREGSEGPRLGDQEDSRRPPFLKTEKNKAQPQRAERG